MSVKRTTQLLFVVVATLIIPRYVKGASGCDGNGNCYVRSTSTCTSSCGANWTSAYTGFGTGSGQVNPGSMTRGVTYWIAGTGVYAAPTFNTADSGTTAITIEGVTAANHGPASDWSSSYLGQAKIENQTTINSDYWTFNGQAVSGCTYPSNNTSCYTLKFWNVNSACPNDCGTINLYGTHVTFNYTEIEGTGEGFPNNTSTSDRNINGSTWEDDAIYSCGATNVASYLYAGHSFIHHTGNSQMQMNCSPSDWATFEYDWISYNHTGLNGGHDEVFSTTWNDLVLRYSVIQDPDYNGVVADAIGPGNVTMNNWIFYGNIIFWDTAYTSLCSSYAQYAICVWNRGSIDMLGNETMTTSLIAVHNTIYGINQTNINGGGMITGVPPGGGQNNGSNLGSPTVYNEDNLYYDNAYQWGGAAGDYCAGNASAVCTIDYNTAYSGGLSNSYNWQTSSTPATHDTNNTSGNPFANATAWTVAGFMPTTPDPFIAHPGVTLTNFGSYWNGTAIVANTFNVDMNGNTFGANGTIDRGALQTGAASSSQPNPPSGLTASVSEN